MHTRFFRNKSHFWLVLLHVVLCVKWIMNQWNISSCIALWQHIFGLNCCRNWEFIGCGPKIARTFFRLMEIVWNAVVLATCWALWLEQNNRISESIDRDSEFLWEQVKFWPAIWTFDTKDFKGSPLSELCRDWCLWL